MEVAIAASCHTYASSVDAMAIAGAIRCSTCQARLSGTNHDAALSWSRDRRDVAAERLDPLRPRRSAVGGGRVRARARTHADGERTEQYRRDPAPSHGVGGYGDSAAYAPRVIDPKLKRALGQMIKGVQIVASTHDGVTCAYTSHWVTQVAFEEPIVMASVSPKHDTHPILAAAGWFTVSVCRGRPGRMPASTSSYPGRKFHYLADEFLTTSEDGFPYLDNCLAWFRAETFERKPMADHELFFARVTHYGYGRLKEPPLVYSSRHGWRRAADKARPPGVSIRDQLLARLAAAGFDTPTPGDDEDD